MSIPKNKQAEYSVVATIVDDPRAMTFAKHLTPDYFVQTDAREIFADMRNKDRSGRMWSPQDYQEFYVRHVNDIAFIDSMLEEHVRRLEEAAVCRAGMQVAKKAASAASQLDADGVEAALSNARLPGRGPDGVTLAQVAADLYDDIGGKEMRQLDTGFSNMDRRGLLFRRQETILAARPGMGKSQLASQISANVAKRGDVVIHWSGEMPAKDVVDRMVQAEVGVSTYAAKDSASVRSVSEALARFAEMDNLYIFDTKMTSMDLWGKARRIADQHGGVDLIVADHIRLFSDTNTAERHRLGQICINLKWAAGELNAAVLAAAQLSRYVEGRDDKKPGLTDLRDSGEIEENTDLAAFIYREGYYQRDRETGDQSGEALVYLGKHRNGRLWGTSMWFQAKNAVRFAEVRPV